MGTIAACIQEAEWRHPGLLPNLDTGPMVMIGSDYAGQHPRYRYEAFALLLANTSDLSAWVSETHQIRHRYLRDRRRFAFSKLGDTRRRRALGPFLETANAMPGLLVAVLISKRAGSLFLQNNQAAPLDLMQYDHWNRTVLERMLRVVHFVSFFLAGLSSPGQNVIWITDEDDIAANPDRLRELTNLAATVSASYLDHNLGHLRVGTTAIDTGPVTEDFVAIADLTAGALAEYLTRRGGVAAFIRGVMTPAPTDLLPKAWRILNWFSDNSQPLRRLVYLIDESSIEPGRVVVTSLRFHGSRDTD
ncbi:MAG TPA: hypothetical protein VGV13_08290 [Methylomirabilota bacterium]|jgi:hypothetical protein|nr:hypothetical protein [Methylomirabilota bacterium]